MHFFHHMQLLRVVLYVTNVHQSQLCTLHRILF